MPDAGGLDRSCLGEQTVLDATGCRYPGLGLRTKVVAPVYRLTNALVREVVQAVEVEHLLRSKLVSYRFVEWVACATRTS